MNGSGACPVPAVTPEATPSGSRLSPACTKCCCEWPAPSCYGAAVPSALTAASLMTWPIRRQMTRWSRSPANSTGSAGDSRFTTWAYKFVILEVSAKLGRHYLRNAPVQAADDAWDRIPDRFGADPAQHAETRELAQALRRAVTESLSERQRRVFVAIIIAGVPLDALAAELGSTRNAIYKTMFDARRKLRAALVADGYLTVSAEGTGPSDPSTRRS